MPITKQAETFYGEALPIKLDSCLGLCESQFLYLKDMFFKLLHMWRAKFPAGN